MMLLRISHKRQIVNFGQRFFPAFDKPIKFGIQNAIVAMLLLVFGLSSCFQSEPKPPKIKRNQTGYHFFSNSATDQSLANAGLDSVLTDFVLRCDSASTYHLLSEAWPSFEFSQLLVQALRENPGAQAALVISISKLNLDKNDSLMPSATLLLDFAKSSRQLQIQVIHPPKPSKRKEKANPALPKYAKLTCNVFLSSKIKSKGRDDGRFSILASSNAFDQLGENYTAELIEIFGDSSMYASFLSFWDYKNDPQNEFETEETHVYSNLYDHKVWYLGQQDYRDPGQEFLNQLKIGLQKSHQPAKIRIAATEWDNCRIRFAQELVAVQKKFELDLRLILKDTNTTGASVAKVLQKVPYEGLRIFPKRDSTQRIDFRSNFLLLQGPFSLHEDGDIAPTSLVIFFSEGLTEASLYHNDGIWLRIADENVFSQAEEHWNELWEAASDTLFPHAQFNKKPKTCPLPANYK